MNELLIFLTIFTILQMLHHEFMSRRSIKHFESITQRDAIIKELRERLDSFLKRHDI